MDPVVVALAAVIAANAVFGSVLWWRGRQRNTRDEQLTKAAARRAAEQQLVELQGEHWVRTHSR